MSIGIFIPSRKSYHSITKILCTREMCVISLVYGSTEGDFGWGRCRAQSLLARRLYKSQAVMDLILARPSPAIGACASRDPMQLAQGSTDTLRYLAIWKHHKTFTSSSSQKIYMNNLTTIHLREWTRNLLSSGCWSAPTSTNSESSCWKLSARHLVQGRALNTWRSMSQF